MSETIKDHETSSEQGNAGRRRLVRGVVALAPLVLTLRSGAAAASCVHAKAVSATLDNNSKPIGVTLVEGDVCYLEKDVPICPTDGTKLDNPVGPPSGPGVTVANSKKCGTWPENTKVAILSSQSAGSILL